MNQEEELYELPECVKFVNRILYRNKQNIFKQNKRKYHYGIKENREGKNS